MWFLSKRERIKRRNRSIRFGFAIGLGIGVGAVLMFSIDSFALVIGAAVGAALLLGLFFRSKPSPRSGPPLDPPGE